VDDKLESEVGIDTVNEITLFLPFPYFIVFGLEIIESMLPVFHFFHNIYKEERKEK
jgi:hypothetical protein